MAISDRGFERWADFATRMAYHGWPDATDERKRKIVSDVRSFIDGMKSEQQNINDWDGRRWPGRKSICVGDRMEDFIDERGYYHPSNVDREHRFAIQLRCCIRAGFDVAILPSAGVIGFDVDMIRRMWDGDPPHWVREWFRTPLTDKTPGTNKAWL